MVAATPLILIGIAQIEEKYWAHRRGSDAHPESPPSFVANFKRVSSVHGSSPPPGEVPTGPMVFEEHEDTTSQRTHTSVTYTNVLFLAIAIPPELETLFQSLQTCLDLRDKYIRKSRQRLGDNPRDHDGHFGGLDDDIADVSGVRPNATFNGHRSSPFEPWKIYPKPPPPHWHPTNKEKVSSRQAQPDVAFKFEDCSIPGPHSWHFQLDDKGVFQVYADLDCESIGQFTS
jgi:AMP deaminase